MVRYVNVAQKIITQSYSAIAPTSMTAAELLQLAGSDEEVEHILSDDPKKRAIRLTQLDSGIRRVLDDYAVRRMRTPLVESSTVPGTYLPVFHPDSIAGAHPDLCARFGLLPSLWHELLSIHFRDFEFLCAKVLELVGCTNVHTTPASKDDGVDVIAELPMSIALAPATPLYRLAGALSFLVYGQAKKYALKNPVEQDEVFEMEGSWNALRNDFFDGRLSDDIANALRKADFRSSDPVLLVLMTTSRFTAGAQKKAESIGAVLMDGEQIAQLILEAGAGVQLDAGGTLAVHMGSLIA